MKKILTGAATIFLGMFAWELLGKSATDGTKKLATKAVVKVNEWKSKNSATPESK